MSESEKGIRMLLSILIFITGYYYLPNTVAQYHD